MQKEEVISTGRLGSGLSSAARALVSGLKYPHTGGYVGKEGPLSAMTVREGLQNRGSGIVFRNLKGKRQPQRTVPPPPPKMGLLLAGAPRLVLRADGLREQETELTGPGRFRGSWGRKVGGEFLGKACRLSLRPPPPKRPPPPPGRPPAPHAGSSPAPPCGQVYRG